MAKDSRLYARFDIGMDEHPKIMLLSDAAFRALVESTLYARRQLTDGFLDERVVNRKWGAKVAEELSANSPERPSWARVDGGWMIHDFGEHQTTTLDIEAKREAGRKGGLAKAKQTPSKPLAPATEVLEQNPSNCLAKTETETETETPKAKRSSATLSDDFIDFYMDYPRKEARAAAVKAYDKALTKAAPETILAGCRRYAADPNREQAFTKLPASWLNGECWDDDPLPARGAPLTRADQNLAKGAQLFQHFQQLENNQRQIGA